MDKQKALKLRPGAQLRLKADPRGKAITVASAKWLPKPWARPGFGSEWKAVALPLETDRANGVSSLASKVRIVATDGEEYVCTALLSTAD